jgi:hypothetical protein
MAFIIQGTSPDYTVALCLEKPWAVHLACGRCDRAPVLWSEAELTALPPDATLGAIAARAKCAACSSVDGVLSTRAGFWGERAMRGRG